MSKSLRLSEKWFRRGLWLVALVFASFLIGLGSTVVGDLPKVEKELTLDDFIDKPEATRLREALKVSERNQKDTRQTLDQLRLKSRSATADKNTGRENFNAWIATRSSTHRSEQDPEVIERTRELERLQRVERQALAEFEKQERIDLDISQSTTRMNEQLRKLEELAEQKRQVAARGLELRVFLYRLALTLPLLGLAAWLFVKKRHSTYWPFVWGFIFFAAFAFFVELVPYLPSYGGYVRYIVGIVLTVVIGRYAIQALNRYLDKQKLAEAMPDLQRRETLSYDTALARLSKSVCAGCERPVDLKNEKLDFCPHCGIGLFNHCPKCSTRKSAFSKFCHSCGASAIANAATLPGN